MDKLDLILGELKELKTRADRHDAHFEFIKRELVNVRAEMTSEFTSVRTEIADAHNDAKAGQQLLRAEMMSEFKSVRTEMADGFSDVRAEMKTEFHAVRQDLKVVREQTAHITERVAGLESAQGPRA
jgi:hypothetical protein